MKMLYLIRHGQTDYNGSGDEAERTRGWLDVGLNKEGKQQAVKIGEYLSKKGLKKLYTSDLKRAKQTAEKVTQKTGLRAEDEMAFRPWDLGEFSGKKCSDVATQMNYYVKNPEEKVEGGESFNHFLQRYLPKLKSVVDSGEQPVGIVTHYRNLKAAMAWRKAGMKDDLSFDKDTMLKDDLQTGSVIEWRIG